MLCPKDWNQGVRTAHPVTPKSMDEPRIAFRPLAESDIPTLYEWLRRPHLREWWRGEQSLAEVRDHPE